MTGPEFSTLIETVCDEHDIKLETIEIAECSSYSPICYAELWIDGEVVSVEVDSHLVVSEMKGTGRGHS